MNEPILMKNKEKMEDLVMIFEKLKDIIAEQLSVEADEVSLDSNISPCILLHRQEREKQC